MKLVVGLGNPGAKYNFTRHNTGFLVLDFYMKIHKIEWGAKPRFGAVVSRVDDVLFVKPQDYYNNVGVTVREFQRYYKIDLADMLVICDDFNLEFGLVRQRSKGSAGGNNGLKSMIKELGTDEFARLRVGTKNDDLRNRMGDVDFVLSKFTLEEKEKLPSILREVSEKIEAWLE